MCTTALLISTLVVMLRRRFFNKVEPYVLPLPRLLGDPPKIWGRRTEGGPLGWGGGGPACPARPWRGLVSFWILCSGGHQAMSPCAGRCGMRFLLQQGRNVGSGLSLCGAICLGRKPRSALGHRDVTRDTPAAPSPQPSPAALSPREGPAPSLGRREVWLRVSVRRRFGRCVAWRCQPGADGKGPGTMGWALRVPTTTRARCRWLWLPAAPRGSRQGALLPSRALRLLHRQAQLEVSAVDAQIYLPAETGDI